MKNYVALSPMRRAIWLIAASGPSVSTISPSGPMETKASETHQIDPWSRDLGHRRSESCELSRPGTYELVCLPLKIEGGDGAPARAILRKALDALSSAEPDHRSRKTCDPKSAARRR